MALQGTNPWQVNVPSPSTIAYQLAGSVMAVSGNFSGGNSSVQLLGSQAVIGSVAVLQGTNPWQVNVPTSSYISIQPAGSVMNVQVSGSVATVGTFSAGNTSVSAYVESTNTSIFSILKNSSVTALQGTNPWQVNVPTPSYISYQLAGSVMAVSGSFSGGNSSVQVVGIMPPQSVSGVGIFNVNHTGNGSIITVIQQGNSSVTGTMSVLGTVPVTQATTPWHVTGSVAAIVNNNIGSIVGTYQEDAAHTSGDRGLFVLAVRNDMVTSIASANLDYTPTAVDSFGRTVNKPFAANEASVIAMASTVSAGVAGGSVLLAAAPGTGLKYYITDFLVTNTGATTTLTNIANSDSSVVARTIAPAGGGSNHSFGTPATTVGTNQALYLNIATASSTVGVQILGYKAP